MRAKAIKRHLTSMSCSFTIITVLLQTGSPSIASQPQSKSPSAAKSVDLLKPELPSSDSTLVQPTPKAVSSKSLPSLSSADSNSNVGTNGPSSNAGDAPDASAEALGVSPISDRKALHVLNGQVSKAGLKDGLTDGESDAGDTKVFVTPDARTVPMTRNIVDLRSLNNPDLKRSLDRLQAILGAKVMQNIQISRTIDLGARKLTMSTEQFRKLEYGVIGMDSFSAFGTANPVVRECFPTCPANSAGIIPGDVLVKVDDYAFKVGDGQEVMWQKVTGRADTPVDITVLRQGQLITFHLKRMNIEDIQDDRIRHTFEVLLSRLGPQQEQP